MDTAIRIEVLPARLGDCLLVECVRGSGPPWRMLVDGGPPGTWPRLEKRLGRLEPDERHIDVAVVTHIDSDHIGGMLSFLRSEYAEDVGDYWFNGPPHLPSRGRVEGSVAEGQSLIAALLGESAGPVLPWNRAFGGGPIDTGDESGFIEVPVPDGPQITVLSPTNERLVMLQHEWAEAVDQARRGWQGVRPEPDLVRSDVLEPLGDLAALAARKTADDTTAPNGSSIALLIEHRGARAVLGADAFGPVLGAGLRGVAAHRGLPALELDAFKLPHHASRRNVTEALLEAAPARHYLVSTNGDTYHHPDDEALARVILNAPDGLTLWFNYRTLRTARWEDPQLYERYGYSARFPEAPETGTVLELPATA
ncbi:MULTISPECIES: MBL fold metallo-hydrolase [unclassified Streptomyces]|uniref:MBL fold metallo-hydrolase n=1 Tax=unclassified Streptomyces TaxID=2593676 RepID=UPI002E328F50|nr:MULTISPECIES: MBL fold metallo-hydrolase [unclassified Streptomyces]WUC68190.1 MBL fold metallo-hydrolase [Streptomyces sp. NBC_00539]